MKVKDTLTNLDETIDSFASIFFEEEDYDEYLKLADSQHFIVTDKWILQLIKKSCKFNFYINKGSNKCIIY